MEEWRAIPGYDGLYQVSNLGRVKSLYPRWNPRWPLDGILKPHPALGYLLVSLYKCNPETGKKTMWGVGVHRLVALAFIGPVPAGHEVNHVDCNRSNNTAENLEYVTRSENMKYAYSHGCHSVTGTKNPRALLTEDDVRIMRQMHAKGITATNIARAFNHSRSGTRDIIAGVRWKHVA